MIAYALSSCKDQLNALPSQEKVDGNVVVDQKSAEVALNGVYYQFAEAGTYRSVPSTKTADGHEVTQAHLAGLVEDPNGNKNYFKNNLITPNSFVATSIWAPAYNLVNTANSVITAVTDLPTSKITESRRKSIIAEAKFMRAYGHARLLWYYAEYKDPDSKYGVFLHTKPINTDNMAGARGRVKDAYDFILADIDEAIQNAPTSFANITVTSWTAKALKARVLINRGAAGDYNNVITLTDDIIKNSPYTLETNLKDIFLSKGLSSNEVMLGTVPYAGQVNKRDNYLYFGTPPIVATSTLKTLLENDPRVSWLLKNNQNYIGIAKYLGSQVEVGYMFRLTEVYLMQAEAITRNNGNLSTAKTLLKTVMQKAGISDFSIVENANTADNLMMEIYKETCKNLLCEDGQEWQALLRFPLSTIQTLRPSIKSKNQFILPIPSGEFLLNPSIGEQNPGYTK
ncbi:RagB/SusD family nutrient uptake outer membrane protein [Chitinophaga sp. MD30]|uniref:RagB/SusD family nutrient uptake outer membrane protein n=2 Tax=Chitinophaga TaxID=79328 RepID=UPI000BAF7F77|nr:RagB/SusD family nutrient uptake outer membrane protein [Chitinophaga sp. MD30]ASZ13260.1 hypothetical protein CK934_20990 [Chitinophaga sp. MD30]